jgi:uncharacterized protein (DUF2141 family)
MRYLKFSLLLSCFACLGVFSAAAQQATIVGPDAAACQTYGVPSVLVQVWGFKDREGNVRVELYPATQEDFLASRRKLEGEGKVFKRIDVPTPENGDAWVCVELPAAGTYALSVLHDRNANGKLDPFSDGFGFPTDPELGMSKPDVEEAMFTAGNFRTDLAIVLQYVRGLLSVGPVRVRPQN